ncbi:hypothetical protein ONZ51_g10764 [Trametes cubensis]|uniref:CCHC-type domain-containing protein n=1 Tax=Trametes cubensis TaxID=1111947 RepID=A0AAD7TIW8_9APHY|nr:hypothetical protein ONZ51_g10764 [Trametes cubensis]
MPVEGTKLAPKTFRGDPAEVEQFLRRFERLAMLHNLSAREKCETIVDYCSKVVRETIQGFSAYRLHNWEELKQNVRIFWNADLEDKRFRIRDLQAFVAHSRKQPIQELKDWRKYLRKFIRIAGWLQGQGKLKADDYAYYMWTGLYGPFRKQLEARILLKDPSHDMAEPFEPEAIRKAAEAILGVDRFDTERLRSDDLYKEDSDEDQSDDLRELERPSTKRTKKTMARSRKTQSGWKDDEEDSDDEDFDRTLPREVPRAVEKESKVSKEKVEEKEFEDLVEKMKKLSVSDPQYGLLFLKACTMKPIAAECLPRPQVNQAAPDRFDGRRMMPPHMPRPDPNRFLSYRQPPPNTGGCFGCGEAGHIMGECPQIQKYLKDGLLLKDFRGRLTLPDGSILRRNQGETWVQAVKRIFPEVHFVTYGDRLDGNNDEDVEESADVLVYPVERVQRETRSYRKQVFDKGGSSSSQDKGKQKESAPSQKPPAPMARFPMQRLMPVETQSQSFNPDKDIEMVEDRALNQRQKKSSAPVSDRTRVPTRASQISKNVDPTAVLDKILDAPVTLSVRDVVGVSKDVANCLQEALKVKKADMVPAPASHLVTSKAGSLIRLEMECNQKPVSFIVDTGSQLNIISESVCKNVVRRPINTGEAISINDANGGSGRLLGLVEDIPLKIGHVKTPISAYVAENPPFDGLLGRPWQRAHKIGIEERDDGTYLTFPNEKGYAKSELLVTTSLASRGAPGVFSAIVKEWDQDDPKCAVIDHEGSGSDDSDAMSIASADKLGSDSVVEPASEKVSVDSESKDGSNSESEGKADSVRDSDVDDKDEDRLDHVLGLLSSKENSVDDEDEWERDMYRKVWRFLEVRNPGSTLTKAGPCTIMTGTSLELQNLDPGVISKTFLLRDAKLFNRAGGCQGHVIVKVVPYSASSCMRFEQLEDDTLREVSVNSVQVEEMNPTVDESNHQMAAPQRPQSTLLTMHGWLEGYTIPFLIDTGSQIDCINANIWRTIGWAHLLTRRAERLLNVTGSRLRCLGVWKAFVTIGTITSMVDLHVVEGLMEAGILGRPWQELNRMSLNDTDEVSQPTIESIEVYESDKLELRDDWLISISKKEQSFILRNVLVRIDGKYREGHGVLHMVYFPHESERARIANAALKGDSDMERNSTDEELEEEQRGRRLFGQRMWPRFTREDLYQSMSEVAFETRNRKSVGVRTDEMKPGDVSEVAGPTVSESGDADRRDNDLDSIASTQPESSVVVGGICGDTSSEITDEDLPMLMPIAQEDDYIVLQQMFGLVDAPLVIANTPGRMPQFNMYSVWLPDENCVHTWLRVA